MFFAGNYFSSIPGMEGTETGAFCIGILFIGIYA